MDERGRTAAVFVVAAVALFAGLGGYGLWDPDEGRHAAIARELWAATTWHGWIVPSHNFEPYYDKPILFYWLTALAYAAAGVNELGARLVPALAALATLGAAHAWAAAVWEPRTARRAVLVLVSSAGFLGLGRFGNLDMLFTCWITLGLLAAERATAHPDRTGPLVAAAAAAGLGMLTKGLAAPLFVAAVPLVHARLVGRPLPSPRAWAIAAVAFALVTAPWYVAAGLLAPAYLRDFFLVHHLGRFAEASPAFHTGPWWYYLPALAALLFPWSLLSPAALAAAWPRRDPGLVFCLVWSATMVIVLSCSRGKLATYALPALPALALATARGLEPLASAAPRVRRLAAAGLGVLGAALVAAPATVARIDHERWREVVAAAAPHLLLLPAAALVLAACWWRGGPVVAARAIAPCMLAVSLLFYVDVAPIVSRMASDRGLARVIAAHPTAPIVSWDVTPASLMFYVGRPIVRLNRPRPLRQLLAAHPFTWIVTSPRHVAAISRAVTIYPWVTAGRRVLYATRPMNARAEVTATREAR
jgi:4-amino-4-deoxy-L-arabinose transferase-like glycosyltransferase